MQLLPSGFALPPAPYLLALGLATMLVGGLLVRRGPPITPRLVGAFAPWMVAGATGYALFQVRAVPDPLAPLFGNPVVYLSTFVLAGAVWLAVADRSADRWARGSAPWTVAASGTLVAGGLLAVAAGVALARGSLTLWWPSVAVAVSVGLAGGTWLLARDRLDVGATGAPGVLVVAGHVLDGVSTAVGTHLGYGEQTPLSAIVIDLGAALPPASVLGDAWLFVVVKLLLALIVVALFGDYVREEPAEGSLVLGLVAAVGLGPGAHNVVLFALA